MMIDEDSFHEQLDTAAGESLAYLRAVIADGDYEKSKAQTARFLLQLHLAYHSGSEEIASYDDDEDEDEVE